MGRFSVKYFSSVFFAAEGTSGSDAARHQDMIKGRVVEAACGQSQFGLPGDGCDLAIRIDGKAYFVEGTGIDDHGDPRRPEGFCNTIRLAKVTGRMENGRFVAEKFELLPG